VPRIKQQTNRSLYCLTTYPCWAVPRVVFLLVIDVAIRLAKYGEPFLLESEKWDTVEMAI
jgi:hypothetical protein